MRLLFLFLLIVPLFAQDTERRLDRLEIADREVRNMLTEIIKVNGQNQLLIQQGIDDRKSLRASQNDTFAIVSQSQGALFIIQWLLMLSVPVITFIQIFQVFINSKRNSYILKSIDKDDKETV